MRIAELYASLQGEGLLTGTPSIFVRASGCNLRCWFCDTPYTSWEPEGEDWPVEEILAEVDRLKWGRLPACPTLTPALSQREREEVGCISEAQCTTQDHDAKAVHFAPLMHPTTGIRHVVITGGEPMLFAEMLPLCDALHTRGLHITIETAGTLYLPVQCDLMSISPKLASSTPTAERGGKWSSRHERTRHQPEVIRRLIADYDYQVKFVIDTPADCGDVDEWLAELPQVCRERVLLMPQGMDPTGLARIRDWLEPYCKEHGFVFCPRKHIEWFGAGRGT